MVQVTVITDEVHSVEADADDGRLLIEPADLATAMGWTLKPEGLCRDDRCVPVGDHTALLVEGRIDLAAVAGVLGRPAVVDAEAGLMAVALASEQRHQAIKGLQAPPFVLADLEGSTHHLDEWRGQKKLIVAFSSW
jgi:hypothetical protein